MILLVTSTFEVVRVTASREKEVVRLDNITRRPGEVKISEERKIPETMIHKDLTDFLLDIKKLQEWKNEEEKTVSMWRNAMRWTPGLRKSLGIFDQIPKWSVSLGSLRCTVSVPVRARKDSCYGCGAPLGLYRMSVMNPFDVNKWRLSWMSEEGLLESLDITPKRGYCPGCLLRKDWNRKIAKELGHMDTSTKRSMAEYESQRQALFLKKQRESLMTRNMKSAERWRMLVRKARETTSTREAELED